MLESNLGLSKAESRQYQAELTVINQLFSEILLGFNSSQDIDLDKLQKQLEDHRDLLQDIVVNEISPEVSSALPKVLLELLNQVNEDKEEEEPEEEARDSKLETIKEESGEKPFSRVYSSLSNLFFCRIPNFDCAPDEQRRGDRGEPAQGLASPHRVAQPPEGAYQRANRRRRRRSLLQNGANVQGTQLGPERQPDVHQAQGSHP